ncbi:hypothetical protein [Nocardiopsis sp. NRRL B-16309]|uniref:hypothetical protein n=1 Tax=Nocardiopsis sp. NRRL B-16309 TaxID=1519494 RepID=UPI000AB34672|nr:hypothetical protein [Nocardiopsis sp. NRRL B-16309]
MENVTHEVEKTRRGLPYVVPSLDEDELDTLIPERLEAVDEVREPVWDEILH